MTKFYEFPNAKYIDEPCVISIGEYANGRKAISIADVDGFPMATATSNIPEWDAQLEEDDVIMKTYSENEGIMEDLIAQGVISEPHAEGSNGFANFPICKLLVKG